MPSLDQDVTSPPVEATSIAAPEMAVERSEVELAVFIGHETTIETSFHHPDQDLNIPAQDVTSAYISFS